MTAPPPWALRPDEGGTPEQAWPQRERRNWVSRQNSSLREDTRRAYDGRERGHERDGLQHVYGQRDDQYYDRTGESSRNSPRAPPGKFSIIFIRMETINVHALFRAA